MKKVIFLAIITLAFVACKKNNTSTPLTLNTIPDSAYFKVKLVKDSILYNEIAIHFDHVYHLYYSLENAEDATVPGINPNLNISALTSDGGAVNIDGIPYTPGVTVPLMISAANGAYFLRAYYLRKIPSYIHIWCKDNYLKDSLDLRTGNYHFTVNHADTNTFGKRRFQIIVR